MDQERGLARGARDNQAIGFLEIFHQASDTRTYAAGGWYGGASRDLSEEPNPADRPDSASHALAPPIAYTILSIPAKLNRITDGLSNTVMLAEQAGLPWDYEDGKNGETLVEATGGFGADFSWAFYRSAEINLTPEPGATHVNHKNFLGLLSFHPGGVVASNFDGSVSFMNEDIEFGPLVNKLARADGVSLD